MKKLLLLLVLLVPFSTFANTADYTKNEACRLKDGYFKKTLSVTYPWYWETPHAFEFIKKSGKLIYFVHLPENGSEVTEAVYAYEYSCSAQKTRQIGDSLTNGLYMTVWLEWVSEKWIIGHIYMGDSCGWDPVMIQTLINRSNGKQRQVDFSQYSGYVDVLKSNKLFDTRMWIQTFGSTNNPNVFNAVLVRMNNQDCGIYEWKGISQIKVTVDISNRTMKNRVANVISPQSSIMKNYTISEYYRFYNGKVQFKSYINGIGRYEWSDTDIDAATMVLSSPMNGKDKYSSFYGAVRLKMNNKNIFVEPIGATSQISSLYFRDNKTDNVYIMGQGYGWLEILPFAKASTLIVLSYADSYDTYMSSIQKNCNANGDDSNLYDITALDINYCYWTFGSSPGNRIEKKTERIR